MNVRVPITCSSHVISTPSKTLPPPSPQGLFCMQILVIIL